MTDACRRMVPRDPWTKFTKIGVDLLSTNAPHHAQFYRALPNDVREKRYNFLRPSLLWRPRGIPWPKFTNLGGDV